MGAQASVSRAHYREFLDAVVYLEIVKERVKPEIYQELLLKSKFIYPGRMKWEKIPPTRGSKYKETVYRAAISKEKKKQSKEFISKIKALKDFLND